MAEVKKSKFIWMNGKFLKWDDAKVHILTHALHYGSSIFEGIHTYKTKKGTAMFRLNEHIVRFFHSANAISMQIRFSKDDLKKAIIDLVRKNEIEDGYVRPLAYYGYGNIGIYPKDIKTEIALVTVPWGNYYYKNLKVMTAKFFRHSEKSTVFGAKIGGNYANSIVAMFEARKKGYDEALMLDQQGYVAEGPAENVFMVKNGVLMTPNSKSALHGITRDSLIKIAKDLRIKVLERKITLKEFHNADEVFFCGTATEIAPVVEIDSRRIGKRNIGKVTEMLKRTFYDVVRGNHKKYDKWVTYV